MSKWKVRSKRESVANFVENPGFFDVLKQEKAKVEEVPPVRRKVELCHLMECTDEKTFQWQISQWFVIFKKNTLITVIGILILKIKYIDHIYMSGLYSVLEEGIKGWI